MSEWPIRTMVYGAGEAINGANALAPQIRTQLSRLTQVATNPYVAAIAQLDSSNVPSIRYVLDPWGRQPVHQLPNINVGDPNELVGFVRWSAAVCPAKRSVLVLSGHGAAWEDGLVEQILDRPFTRIITAVPPVPGAIHHARSVFGHKVSSEAAVVRALLIDGHDRDYLSNAELGAACSRITSVLGGKIDVLVLDACLMSSWEILQELCDSVETVVASVDELSAAGIDIAGAARELTLARGMADANVIAATIARGFRPQAAFDSCVAIDLTKADWAAAISAFRTFCSTFLPWIQASATNADAARAALRNAGTSLVKFSGGGLADVRALADAIAGIPTAPANAVTSLKVAAASLGACVLALSAGRDYQSAMGISIFAPGSTTFYRSNRPDYVRLQFSSLTGWGAILDVLFGFGSDNVRFVVESTQQPVISPDDDAEFVVVLRGFPIDNQTRDRIEKVIRHTVLDKLAEVDALGDVTVTPSSTVLNTRRIRRPGEEGWIPLGLVVRTNSPNTF